MNVYQFIDNQSKEFPSNAICKVLKVSRSAYCACRAGSAHRPSEFEKSARSVMRKSFLAHKKRYGSRRLSLELTETGFGAGRHRIRHWMKEESLKAIQARSFVPQTTDSRHTRKPSPNLRQSVSRKGDCYDNAFAESFFSRYKAELIQGGIFHTFEDAFSEIFDYLECYCNSRHRHSAFGYITPETSKLSIFQLNSVSGKLRPSQEQHPEQQLSSVPYQP